MENKMKYDNVLILMSLDLTFEETFGEKYVKQELFDKFLKDCGVSKPNGKYIESRLKEMMDSLVEQLSK